MWNRTTEPVSRWVAAAPLDNTICFNSIMKSKPMSIFSRWTKSNHPSHATGSSLRSYDMKSSKSRELFALPGRGFSMPIYSFRGTRLELLSFRLQWTYRQGSNTFKSEYQNQNGFTQTLSFILLHLAYHVPYDQQVAVDSHEKPPLWSRYSRVLHCPQTPDKVMMCTRCHQGWL